MFAHRLQRYEIFFLGYTYKIEFVKGVENGNANALSRLLLQRIVNINNDGYDTFFIYIITSDNKSIYRFECM